MMQRVLTTLGNKPFLIFLVFSIFLAYLHPEIGAKGGLLKPEITVKYGAIIVIFFISGVSLPTQELLAATYQYRIHCFIQIFSLVLVPLVVQLFGLFLDHWYPNSELLIGFVTVSCMPPPVSSAVLLTKKVGGNEAAAVFNSALGSLLGLFVTPSLLYLFFSESADVSIWTAILQLGMTVVLPVILGQFTRLYYGNIFSFRKKELSAIGSFMLLLIIYTTFCETFSSQDQHFTVPIVIITITAVIFLQVVLLSLSFYASINLPFHFTPEDIVAILYCSTHKSLTLGFPMLKVLYANQERFILISFPLLVYHPMQILIGSLLVPFLQKWVYNSRKLQSKLHFV